MKKGAKIRFNEPIERKKTTFLDIIATAAAEETFETIETTLDI